MRRAHAAALALVLLTFVVTAVVVVSRFSGDERTPEPDATQTRTIQARPSPTVAEPVPPPDDGACHQLTYAEAVAPTTRSEPVRCSGEHTAQTFLVDTLGLVEDGHLLAVDSARAQEQAASRCRGAVAAHLGSTPEEMRLAMLDAVWFTPTVDEAGEGADWLRCDVVAVTAGQRLAPLPASTRGLLGDQAGRDRFGMCATSAPGEDGFERVLCSSGHRWRAVTSVPLPGDAYPSAEEAAGAMKGRCRSVARDRAEDPLDFRWAEERPTREQWRQGRRYGLCWVPD